MSGNEDGMQPSARSRLVSRCWGSAVAERGFHLHPSLSRCIVRRRGCNAMSAVPLVLLLAHCDQRVLTRTIVKASRDATFADGQLGVRPQRAWLRRD